MTSAPLRPPAGLDLTRAPIDRLPHTAHTPDRLHTFVTGSRRWERAPVLLPVPLTAVLWCVLAAAAGMAGWLLAVRNGVTPCSGLPCRVATLDDHPDLLLVLSGGATLALGGAAAGTRGFSTAGGPALAVLVIAALAGVGSLLGVLALLVLAAVAIVFALSLLALLTQG